MTTKSTTAEDRLGHCKVLPTLVVKDFAVSWRTNSRTVN